MEIDMNEVKRIALLGGGVSNCFLAYQLRKNFPAISITIFDKGRTLGGRLAAKDENESDLFTHGAQFFTARHPVFKKEVSRLMAKGLVTELEESIGYLRTGAGSFIPAKEGSRFRGAPFMNSFIKEWLKDVDVHLSTKIKTLERIGDTWRIESEKSETFVGFDVAVLSFPPPQGYPFWQLSSNIVLPDFIPEPCWAVLLKVREIELEYPAAFLNDKKVSWYSALDKSAVGNTNLVLHGSGEWSAQNLDLAEDLVVEILVAEFEDLVGVKLEILSSETHRWIYAKPKAGSLSSPQMSFFDPDIRLGYVGDWFSGGRVEGAITSALHFSERLGTQSRSENASL
eukprot:snap_masked-scaffold_78-processed-gene-0.48-mRNA-1 protein AED:1.00 eAED:1.00 QI:0/-1/0/0/-1/1/1/0/340